VLDVLDCDALMAVFVFVGTNSLFAASLVCTTFNALRPSGTHFRTSVLAMNYTPSMLAWASCLPVPCPRLTCVADLDDNAKVWCALRSLGRLGHSVIVQHAAAIVRKLVHVDVDVRFEAVNTLGKLDSVALAMHIDALLLKLEDADADVRYATVNVFKKLDPLVIAEHVDAIASMCSDSDEGVQLAVHNLLGHLYRTLRRIPCAPGGACCVALDSTLT